MHTESLKTRTLEEITSVHDSDDPLWRAYVHLIEATERHLHSLDRIVEEIALPRESDATR